MIESADLAGIRSRLGDDAVLEHPPISCDGVELGWTIRPADGAALSEALSGLSERGVGVLVRGGGNRLEVGNPPSRACVLLSTERLRGVAVFEPAEGVCRVLAGTPIADLRAAVEADGWEVPLDPPGPGATVGGVLAAAAFGPRAHGQGLPRDAVLGLEVVLADGQRTRCGGRVVKNVTGYDIAKLYTGSFGSLGVIEAAWLRLRPRPRSVRCLTADLLGSADAFGMALAAARRPSARAVCLGGGEGVNRLTVEFAGDEPTTAGDAAWLSGVCAATDSPVATIDALREHQGALAGAGGLRFRIAARASRAEALASAQRAAGAETLWYPGLQVAYVGYALPTDRAAAEEAARRAFASVTASVATASGSSLCESAPVWAKRGRDMHGEGSQLVPLMRGLKQRFDPQGSLNPGRFAGGL